MPHTNNQYLSHFIVIIPLALSSTTFFGRKEKKKGVKVPYSLLTFNIKFNFILYSRTWVYILLSQEYSTLYFIHIPL